MKNKVFKNMNVHMVLSMTTIFVLLSTTFAWFYYGNVADTSEIGIEVADNTLLKIKEKKDDSYTTETKIINVDSNFTFKEACLSLDNDEVSFYTVDEVVFDESSDVSKPIINSFKKLTEEEINDYICVVDITMQSAANGYLFLHESSNITPKDVNDNYSAYGDFSKDYIAGAARILVSKYDETSSKYEPCFVYIPNPNIELSLDSTGYKLNPDGNVEDSFIFLKNGVEDSNSIVETNANSSGYKQVSMNNKSINVAWGDLVNNELPVTFIENGDCDYRIYIWIDGYDRETQIPLAGGKINFNLVFSLKNDEGGSN